MLKVENIDVSGWGAAVRGMRNPLESWDKSDSFITTRIEYDNTICVENSGVGDNDLALMRKLCARGSDHRKFMRMLHVSMDVTAPLFWWKEYDTYKVATVRNSCSTMHRIHVHPISRESFTAEGIAALGGYYEDVFNSVVGTCEALREMYNEKQDKRYWRALIELMPEGYNMLATIDFNYETALNMRRARANHKLTEWRTLCAVIDKLPYFTAITGEGTKE